MSLMSLLLWWSRIFFVLGILLLGDKYVAKFAKISFAEKQ